MKRAAFAILLLSLSLAAYSFPTVNVKGRITDAKTGEPVVGAVVRLDKDYLWATTDVNGEYSMQKIDAGTYILNISCLGYVDIEKEISLRKDSLAMNFRLNVSTLALNEVVVTAETSKDNLNTTQKLGRNALDHLQMSDMSNISALLPGGKTINPDLTVSNPLSLRSAGLAVGNAAFGTAIEMDGVRIGGNADFNGMGGVGTRSISVDNIESVEILTGVPSAEYGDLNSGLVRVITKKGRSPVSVVFSVNPRTYETSVSKGFDLGNDRGILNVSGEWARATKKLSSPYTSYTRRSFTVDYSNTFKKVLRLEAGLSGNIGGMNSKNDPDSFSEAFEKANDNSLTPHFKAVWLLNRSWITNLTMDGSIYYNDRHTQVHEYNSYASSQPAVHSEVAGYYIADALPLNYYSDRIIDSKELDYSLSLKYSWLKRWNKVKNMLKAGLQWKADGNVGKGEYYKDASLAANGYRPRPYKDYPYMFNLAGFVEDNLELPLWGTILDLGLGLRYEKISVKGSRYNRLSGLSPRLNAKWHFGDNFSIRGGWGVTEKSPSFFVLYPKQEYLDIQTFGFSYGDSGAASYIYYTIPYTNRFNPDLVWQKNYNSEIGADAKFKGVKLSLTGYCNITYDPYMTSTVYDPFTYNIMSLPDGYKVSAEDKVSVDPNTGYVTFTKPGHAPVTSELKVEDKTFVASPMADNGARIIRAGAELTVDFPEIKPIRTQFRLDASYGYIRYVDENDVYYYKTGWSHTRLQDRSYQYVGIYPGNAGVSNGRRLNSVDMNVTAITHIPQARLVVTCRLEAALLRRNRNLSSYNGKDYAFTVDAGSIRPTGGYIYDGNSYSAVKPIAYMDLDGKIHQWTEVEDHSSEYNNLILRSGNIYTFAKDGYDPYFSANISVTKEIGNHVSLSFFANNFTNSRRFVKSHATGMSAIFTPVFYYGLTLRLKF